MLLKTKRDNLLKLLITTSGFVEKKQTMPILSNVYLNKSGASLTIIANDLEIQASITNTAEMEGDDFTITMPGKKLLDILKSIPENATVTWNNKKVKCWLNREELSSLFKVCRLNIIRYLKLRVSQYANLASNK